MGTITRSFANNLTTGGVLKADAFNNASLNNVTALNAAIATGGMVSSKLVQTAHVLLV
jgi:hypothetical protein